MSRRIRRTSPSFSWAWTFSCSGWRRDPGWKIPFILESASRNNLTWLVSWMMSSPNSMRDRSRAVESSEPFPPLPPYPSEEGLDILSSDPLEWTELRDGLTDMVRLRRLDDVTGFRGQWLWPLIMWPLRRELRLVVDFEMFRDDALMLLLSLLIMWQLALFMLLLLMISWRCCCVELWFRMCVFLKGLFLTTCWALTPDALEVWRSLCRSLNLSGGSTTISLSNWSSTPESDESTGLGLSLLSLREMCCRSLWSKSDDVEDAEEFCPEICCCSLGGCVGMSMEEVDEVWWRGREIPSVDIFMVIVMDYLMVTVIINWWWRRWWYWYLCRGQPTIRVCQSEKSFLRWVETPIN